MARFECDKTDELRLAVIVQELAGAHEAAAKPDAEMDAVWVDAALERLYLLVASGTWATDPRWIDAVDAACVPVRDHGTLANRSYFAYVRARNCVDASRWREAGPLVQEAIATARAAGEKRPELWLDLIDTYLKLGDPVRALDVLREHKKELAAAAPDRAAEASRLAVETYLRCGLPDLAAVSLDEFDRRTAGLDSSYEIDRMKLRANFARETEDFDTAMELASALLDRPDLSSSDRAHMLIVLGVAQWEKTRVSGHVEEARASLQAALDEPGIDDARRCEADLVLFELELRANQHDAAREHLEIARALLAQRAANPQGFVTPAETALFEAESAQLALALHAPQSELRVHQEQLARAFEAAWKTFEQGPARVGGVGYLYYLTQAFIVSQRIQLELAIDPSDTGVEAALSVLLRAQRAGSTTRASKIGEVDLHAVTSALCRDGAGIVVILPGIGSSDLFLIDSAKVLHYPCAERDVLHTDVLALLRPTMSPYSKEDAAVNEADIARAAHALTQHLLPEGARARLSSWKGVYVVGTELIRNFPFESLYLDGEREIGLEKPLSYLSSLPAGVWLTRRADARDAARSRSSTSSAALVLSPKPGPNVDPSGPLPSLDLSADDEEMLSGPFRPAPAHVFRGEAAVPACLSSTFVSLADVLVILAHGLHDLRHGERPSGIALTADDNSDGVLWIEAVELLAVPPLVFLYTCGSARGPVRMGDDAATHLGGAFQTAGADAVLVNQGDTLLHSALAVGHVMHEARASGESPAEGLRRARALAAQDPKSRADLLRSRVRIYGIGLRTSPKMVADGGSEARSASKAGWILGASAVAILLCLFLALNSRASLRGLSRYTRRSGRKWW